MGHFVSYLQVIHSSNMTWCFNYKSKLFVVLVMGFVVSSLITVNAAPTEKSVTPFGDKGITENPVASTETPVTSPETPDTSTEPAVTSSGTPVTSTETSVTSTETPVTSSETPVTSTETSVTSSETPDTSSGTPDTSTETSVTSTQKPDVTTSGAPSMGATLSALVIVDDGTAPLINHRSWSS